LGKDPRLSTGQEGKYVKVTILDTVYKGKIAASPGNRTLVPQSCNIYPTYYADLSQFMARKNHVAKITN
jgi:hypothetical protein